MVNDELLFHLNDFVNRLIESGAGVKKTLDALKNELETGPYIVRTEDLYFDPIEAKRNIPHHVLLGDRLSLQKPQAYKYRALSGSGQHYNGMWGDCSMLQDDEAAARILDGFGVRAASVCEQVTICVKLLSNSCSSLHPEIAQATRKHLSGMLMKYPVLLHPAVLFPALTEELRPEFGSLVYLLSKTSHGGLPRYSHFEADDGKRPLAQMPNQELIQRLTAFARHPCVAAGLLRAGMRACLNRPGTSVLIGKANIIETMSGVLGSRVQFISSVMETEELQEPMGPNTTRGLPFPTFVRGASAEAERARTVVTETLATSVQQASGVVHLAAGRGTIHPGLREHRPDPRLLACVRDRMPDLCGLDKPGSHFQQCLVDGATRRIFLRHQNLPVDELASNATRMARAFEACGFSNSLPEAARFLASAVLGPNRPSTNLPAVDSLGAVTFLKAIDEMGGLGQGHEALDTLHVFQSWVRDFPARELPFRGEWESALRVLKTEKTMLSAMGALPGPASNQDASADSTISAPVTRRARAAI